MYRGTGYVIKGVGGLYTVELLPWNSAERAEPQPLDGQTVTARGRGNLRRDGELFVGDLVEIGYTDASFAVQQDGTCQPSADGTGVSIDRILPRHSSLIRPPLANPDLLFVTFAAASPTPDTGTVDKMLSIAAYNGIAAVIVITKTDRAPKEAERLADIYRLAGYPVYPVCGLTGEGTDALKNFLFSGTWGKIAAFSGASGVGKSTLLGKIFPDRQIAVGDLSQRIARGKNTTRHVELFPLSQGPDHAYLADTPGFTMLDFERFDFFRLEDLPATFPDFVPYIHSCRYSDCTHTKEEGCAVLQAVRSGKIAPSRHQSYLDLYTTLKKKPFWE